MKRFEYKSAIRAMALVAFMLRFACCAFAEIKMGTPFSDGAVLQRDMAVPVWGTVSPAKGKVTVKFARSEERL